MRPSQAPCELDRKTPDADAEIATALVKLATQRPRLGGRAVAKRIAAIRGRILVKADHGERVEHHGIRRSANMTAWLMPAARLRKSSFCGLKLSMKWICIVVRGTSMNLSG
ncbi:hypothetical protein BRADO4276 [Bradyrhizobium sp. ORS 278]|uniref:hypothetical protein n=1 Tax=Bradyrhizobium sp. (strain ORS 278) TaxID=114615 RepID=UPI0001508E71|nr:hypothetical protein [Bradyrhizobium sp. ORS 278]CAL78025.1 hypothetical protein BRADO4276 [Bradyrhizobium sp. ORS 278]